MKCIILFVLCAALHYLVVTSYKIQYIESVQRDYYTYFNLSLSKELENKRIFIHHGPTTEEKFLIEYQLGNKTILDLRTYYFSRKNRVYTTTDQGIFFPKQSIKDILKFIYFRKDYDIILTDLGFLFFDYIKIENQPHLYIKMMLRGQSCAKFRGILLDLHELRILTSALNTYVEFDG